MGRLQNCMMMLVSVFGDHVGIGQQVLSFTVQAVG